MGDNMKEIPILEACKIKGLSRPYIQNLIKAGKLDSTIHWEKRNGYERKITYIIANEKFNQLERKRKKEGKIIIAKKGGGDAWKFRNDLMGRECVLGARELREILSNRADAEMDEVFDTLVKNSYKG